MSTTNQWHLKGVDDETKQRLRVYALLHGLTLAQALKQLLDTVEMR